MTELRAIIVTLEAKFNMLAVDRSFKLVEHAMNEKMVPLDTQARALEVELKAKVDANKQRESRGQVLKVVFGVDVGESLRAAPHRAHHPRHHHRAGGGHGSGQLGARAERRGGRWRQWKWKRQNWRVCS